MQESLNLFLNKTDFLRSQRRWRTLKTLFFPQPVLSPQSHDRPKKLKEIRIAWQLVRAVYPDRVFVRSFARIDAPAWGLLRSDRFPPLVDFTLEAKIPLVATDRSLRFHPLGKLMLTYLLSCSESNLTVNFSTILVERAGNPVSLFNLDAPQLTSIRCRESTYSLCGGDR